MSKAKIFLIILLVSVLLIPENENLKAQNNGIIKGKIEIKEVVKSSRRHRSSYKHNRSQNSSTTSKNEAENVIIYLEEVESKKEYSYGVEKPVLTQKDAKFIPKVLPILKGTTVDIKNEDKIYHNVFSLSDPKPFNIGRRPQGESVPQTFDNPGVVRVFCDIHSHMSAFIVVLENPHFTTADENGNYEILDLPPGKYIVNPWHHSTEATPVEITITAGETKVIDFELK